MDVLSQPDRTERRGSRWGGAVGGAIVLALYLLSFPYHPALRSPNELSRLWQSRSLAELRALNIDAILVRDGRVGDLSCTARGLRFEHQALAPCVGPEAPRGADVERRHYPSKAPLTSFLGAPIWWGLIQTGFGTELAQVLVSRMLVTVLPTLGLLVLLRRHLMALVSKPVAELFVVAYALGTMAFNYAEAFMSHQLVAVLLFSAYHLAVLIERGVLNERAYLLMGVALGAAVCAEYTAALGAVCIGAYPVLARFRRWRELARPVGFVLIGAAPLLAALASYHRAAFGSGFATGYQYLAQAAYQPWHRGGVLGIGLPDLRALGMTLFSARRGLLMLSPFLVIGLAGIGPLRRGGRAAVVVFGSLIVTHLYFTASFALDSWGWTVGPRHLTALLPFLSVLAALGFDRILRTGRGAWLSLSGGLVVSSIWTIGVVGFVNYIPESVSTPTFGLALPLLTTGHYPVSWLCAWLPNPASGALLIVLLALAVGWTVWWLVRLGARPGILVAAIVVHLGVSFLATSYSVGESRTVAQLGAAWSAPAGARLRFRAR